MKTFKTILVLLVTNLVSSAQNSDGQLLIDLKTNIQKIEFVKLIFFHRELVEMSTDSVFMKAIVRKLELKSKSLQRFEDNDRLEHLLVLKQIFDEVERADKNQQSKKQLLLILKQYIPTEPSIDEAFILTQLDNEKRGLINGYDEGVTSESRFVFFVYNPTLLRRTMERNDMMDKWKRMGIFLCNYLRDEEIPNSIRKALYDRLKSRVTSQAEPMGTDIIRDLEECRVLKPRHD
jgi:hypothetical protein